MLSVKRITVLLAAAMLILAALPAMASDLTIKESKTRAGIMNVRVPYIEGAAGGRQVDLLVNQLLLSEVNGELNKLLSESELKTFDATHKAVPELADALKYNSELVKYADRIITNKTGEGRAAASWYARSEYEVKSAKDTFLSVILKIRTYTGNKSDEVVWKTMNFDLRDGRQLALKDLFEDGADYTTRLQTLIGYQQAGRARLIKHIKGKEAAVPEAAVLTGEDSFYVDDHYNLGIILQSENPKTASTKMDVYDISLNDFADLIKL